MTKIKHRLFAAAGDSTELRSNRRSPSSSSVSPFAAFLTPAFIACSSPSSDVDPALLRFRHSASTSSPHRWSEARRQILQMRSSPSSSPSSLSPIGNLRSSSPLYRSPLRVVDLEEDVLVMDGVLVSDSLNSKIRRKDDSNRSGESGSSVSSNSSVLCKMELCRSWEELGVCRYGASCQFAHGKEELRFDLRGPRSSKQKTKVVGGSGSKSVPSAGSSTYTNKSHHENSPLRPTTPDSDITATTEETTSTQTIELTPTKTPEPPKTSTFSWPPTREDDAYITKVLYGPSSRPRLPVFEDVCPK